MTRTFARDDEGQALVIVGLAMVVLMGGLVLAVDWGHGLVARRVAQNEADAASLAAGRLLATTFVDASAPFGVSPQEVWRTACVAAIRNVSAAAVRRDRTLSVWFSADPATTPFSVGGTSTWTGVPPAPSDDCTQVPVSGPTDVDGGTVFVRVVSSADYDSLFGVVTRQPITAAASARVRLTAGAAIRQLRLPAVAPGGRTVGPPGVGLSGFSTAPNVALWPIVVQYRNWTAAAPSGQLSLLEPSGNPGNTDANFFASLTHFSAHEAQPQVHQLITETDYTASSLAQHGHPSTQRLPNSGPDRVIACGSTDWDTNGAWNSQPNLVFVAECDVPKWFNYGFRGSLSVSTNWTPSANPNGWGDPATGAGFEGSPDPMETPDPFPGARSSCAALTTWPFLTVPSCPDSASSANIGDWVETVRRADVDERVVRDRILSFIARYGRDVSGDRAVVVNVFLWDCAEQYVPGDQWQPITPGSGGSDCSNIDGADLARVDRVHLFAAVPMTIFESDVWPGGSARITARLGSVFGDAGDCIWYATTAPCRLNPLMNSAFLVPDE